MANTNDPFAMSDNIFERIETHLEAARAELDSFVDDVRAAVINDQAHGRRPNAARRCSTGLISFRTARTRYPHSPATSSAHRNDREPVRA